MAIITNTFTSYDAKGIREDLEDVIYNISPEETPFYSNTQKVKATNRLHEWQTDSLRSSGANAHIEGDETTFNSVTPTVRLGNYTQIFKNAVVIPDSDTGMDKAGRSTEIAYQTLKIAKEQKLDIEKALFDNNEFVAGASGTARELAGAPCWIDTNTSKGTGGVDPSSVTGYTVPGSKPRTDGTTRAFTQTLFDTVMQEVWDEGGNPNRVYLSSGQMVKALSSFSGMNNQRSTIGASVGGTNAVVNAIDVYVTPWGTVEFTPSRENRSRDVFIMQDDMWAIGVLRPTKNTALAKTGDAEKRQIVTELTLVCKNEKANGIVADLN